MSLLVHIIGNICTGLIGGVIYMLRGAREIVSEGKEEPQPTSIDNQ
jgi:hypothetical protein